MSAALVARAVSHNGCNVHTICRSVAVTSSLSLVQPGSLSSTSPPQAAFTHDSVLQA